MHYSQLYFGKQLHMFRTDLLKTSNFTHFFKIRYDKYELRWIQY